MKGKQILFFATKEDMLPIVRDFEMQFQAFFFQMGMFDHAHNLAYKSISEISAFGKPLIADWNKDLRLIMIPREVNLVVREVPQKSGGLKYAVDPLENQISICFQFGGVVEEGILLAGNCSTIFLSDFSLSVFNTFSSLLKKRFKKVKEYYVGTNAEDCLKNGWRLVTNDKLSKGYDLRLN